MGRKKIKPGRIFDTVADVFSICTTLLYVFYVALLLIFNVGTEWLNYCMLGFTIAYIVFFLIKIFSLNRILATRKFQKITRTALKYSKWAMKIINATFVVFTLANVEFSGNHIISMIGVFLVGFSFLISVLWDVSWFIIGRKLRELKQGWDDLPPGEKNRRVETAISSIIQSIDNVAGLDITQSVTEQIAARQVPLLEAEPEI